MSICFFISIVFLLLCYFVSFSFLNSSINSCSPFECGFSPFIGYSVLFSMPFFLITIMFLLFDVEILILCFYPLMFSMSYEVGWFSLFVIIMVLFSTLYEWSLGVISWF